MKETRYKTVTITISKEKAESQRQNEILHVKGRIEALYLEIRDLERREPKTSWQIQSPVLPGQEGYEEASKDFNPILYHGGMKWLRRQP